MSADEITTGQIRAEIYSHFESIFANPSNDVIADIISELDPDYDPWSGMVTDEQAELEEYASKLWARAQLVFGPDPRKDLP